MKAIKEISIILLIIIFTLLGFGAGFTTGVNFTVDTSVEMLNAVDVNIDNIEVSINESSLEEIARDIAYEIYEKQNS